MPSWIETSLKGAVLALTRSGDVELAADIGRLLDEPDLTSLRLLKSREAADLADQLYDCEDLDHLASLLEGVCSTFHAAHCTIHRVRERQIGGYGTRVLSTYPEAWIDTYIARRHFTVDPVIARALESPGLFFWDELPADGPLIAAFLRDAEAHGVGPAGITLVADNAAGDTFAVSLAVPVNHAAFRQIFATRISDFEDIALLLVEVFSDLTCTYPGRSQALTDDQLKVLKALASGQTPAELEEISISYGSFATLETSILRSLEVRSLFQAVARAACLRLLETVPLFDEDVYRPGGPRRIPGVA